MAAMEILGQMLADKVDPMPNLEYHIMDVVAKLAKSVFKSAANGDDRGDFAKGREQMAMHAIALLVGAKNWKEIERILFGDGNGD